MQLWRKFYLYVGVGIIAANTLVAEDPAHPTESESQTRGRTVTVAAVPSRARIHLGSYRIGETIKVNVQIKNGTETSLTLRAIDPDCGCLAVVPDRRDFDQGEVIRLSLHLASTNKIANVRRSIRILFQESSAPFVLDVDVRVTGPMRLRESTFRIDDPVSAFRVDGNLQEAGIRIARIESVRGSFVVNGAVQQTANRFHFNATPTFSFGDAGDLVRVHYHDLADQQQIADLPIALRFTTPIRFLPSTLNVDQQGNHWIGQARMIIVPGKLGVHVRQLRFVADTEIASGSSESTVSVAVHSVSSVLSKIHVVISGDGTGSTQASLEKKIAFPKSLTVRGPDNRVLGILYLARHGDE